MEITQQRSRFGRTNIFYWSCVLGVHLKTMWNKKRYCWQFQNDVRIANFRGWSRETPSPSKSSYFFIFLWYGGSCKEMCGTTLWVGKQDDSTTLKVSTSCIDDHHFKEEDRTSVGEMSQVCSQIVLKCPYLARIGRPDILWSVNKLARAITSCSCYALQNSEK